MTEAVRDDTRSAHAVLRARTGDAHERVDALFGRFALNDASSYRRFLLAHARVLPSLEDTLREAGAALPPWRSRLALLADDLDALGEAMPASASLTAPPGEAARHGLLYVLEGSRLGGKMMARAVPPELPSRFLSAGHLKGEWRGLLAALDRRAETESPAWLDEAVEGARFGFKAYETAAV